jgi:predicted NBD/HSP70 family sugar kinase
MVNICDPEVITLAGYVAENCFDVLKEKLNSSFGKQVYNYSERKIEINLGSSGKNALITGAAVSVLQS